MRAAGTAPTLGTLFAAAEANASPAAAAPGARSDAAQPTDARAVAFAAMLATRLGAPAAGRPRAGATGLHAAAGEPAAADDAEATVPNAPGASADIPALPVPGAAAAFTPGPVPGALVATGPGEGVTRSETRTTGAPAAIGVRRVSRDPDSLAPALRDRLGRVVTRMQREYGYNVQIAEAGRTQARQDFLFGQGRTRSGPVVTWTRSSNHTRGRAVDVTIDGGYDDPAAFARLRQVAQAEGLHTLGSRDPGHLELPHDMPGELHATALDGESAPRITVESFGIRTEHEGAAGAPPAGNQAVLAQIAPVAVVAPVAGVARVAGVAPVAAVATAAVPLNGALAAVGPSPASSAPARAPRASGDDDRARTRDGAHASASIGTSDDTADSLELSDVHAGPRGAASRPRRGSPDADRVAAVASSEAGADARRGPDGSEAEAPGGAPAIGAIAGGAAPAASDAGVVAPPVPVASNAGADRARPAAPTLGAVAAERIARVLDAQQAGAPRTVAHLTLRVERAGGGEDRIRLDLRGRAVDARIDVADLGAADQLAARAPELRAALARHGLTTDDVRVHAAGSATPATPGVGGADPASAVDGDAGPTGLGATAGSGFGAAAQHSPGNGREAFGESGGRNDGRLGDRPADDPPPERARRDDADRRPDDSRSGDSRSGDPRSGDQRQGRRPRPDADLELPGGGRRARA